MNEFRNSEVISIQTDQYPKGTCREFDPEIFFEDENEKTIEKAKTIYSFCPHLIQCRDVARNRGEQHGTFGGESAKERKSFLRKANRDKVRPLGINQINAPHVVKLRKQGLPNYLIAESLGINDKGVDRALAYAKRVGIDA